MLSDGNYLEHVTLWTILSVRIHLEEDLASSGWVADGITRDTECKGPGRASTFVQDWTFTLGKE